MKKLSVYLVVPLVQDVQCLFTKEDICRLVREVRALPGVELLPTGINVETFQAEPIEIIYGLGRQNTYKADLMVVFLRYGETSSQTGAEVQVRAVTGHPLLVIAYPVAQVDPFIRTCLRHHGQVISPCQNIDDAVRIIGETVKRMHGGLRAFANTEIKEQLAEGLRDIDQALVRGQKSNRIIGGPGWGPQRRLGLPSSVGRASSHPHCPSSDKQSAAGQTSGLWRSFFL